MTAAIALARSYGVAVVFADLGAWGEALLRAEYDPNVPEIRLNLRYAQTLAPPELGEFVALAVGHELYHHREAIGEVPPVHERAARENATALVADRRHGRALPAVYPGKQPAHACARSSARAYSSAADSRAARSCTGGTSPIASR